MRYAILLCAAVIVLAGCAKGLDTPITNQPAQPLQDIAQTLLSKQDLLDTAYNWDQAQAIGIIPADSPIPGCVHGLLQEGGFEPAPGAAEAKSFTPRHSGPFSDVSIGLIDAIKLKATIGAISQGGLTLPTSCDAVNGMLLRMAIHDAVKGGISLIPGAGILKAVTGQ